MESNRQKKIAGILQRDVAEVIQEALRKNAIQGILVSVTRVRVTVDLSIAKVYLSVFPFAESQRILKEVRNVKSQIKHEVAGRTRQQLRRMPELDFYIDDSLEYIDKIDQELHGTQNPIENPDLLENRKKK